MEFCLDSDKYIHTYIPRYIYTSYLVSKYNKEQVTTQVIGSKSDVVIVN